MVESREKSFLAIAINVEDANTIRKLYPDMSYNAAISALLEAKKNANKTNTGRKRPDKKAIKR